MDKTYENFIEQEGIPVLRKYAIEDIMEIPVEDWARTGGKGAYVLLDGRGIVDSYVSEIPAGKELKEQHHLYEALVYVASGSGRTELWNDAGFAQAFNWEKGAAFAIPLNVHYRFINRSDAEPARLYHITNAPIMMGLFHEPEFIFNCSKDFYDRFSPEQTDYTRPVTSDAHRHPFLGDLVPSAFDADLPPAPDRGADGAILLMELANSSIGSHIAEFPAQTYKKAHRHAAGAHVILLTGTGYSLLWKDREEPTRVDWKHGAVLVPPEKVFHQHFNTGDEPARYLALRPNGNRSVLPSDQGNFYRPYSQGGDQIEYEEEDPRIKELFEQEIVKGRNLK